MDRRKIAPQRKPSGFFAGLAGNGRNDFPKVVFRRNLPRAPRFASWRGLLVLLRRHPARQNQLAAQGSALRCGSAQSIIMTTTDAQANARLGGAAAGAAPQKCFVCDREIVDDRPFCKILREEEPTVTLCCPRCALCYFDSLHPTTNGDELDRAA